MSPLHRLAGGERVHIRDLGAELFVGHNIRSPAREKVIETFRAFQTPLNITIEITSIETNKRFVAMNLGVAFCLCPRRPQTSNGVRGDR